VEKQARLGNIQGPRGSGFHTKEVKEGDNPPGDSRSHFHGGGKKKSPSQLQGKKGQKKVKKKYQEGRKGEVHPRAAKWQKGGKGVIFKR